MTEILFICPNDKPELRKEVNGTLLLGTRLLEAGFSVDVLRFWQIASFQKDYSRFVEDLAQRILEIGPKCVSFYCLWPQYHTVIQTARLLKERRPDLTVIFGGPQPTLTARETMESIPWVDHVCAGEGENTVVPFFTALLRGGDLSQIPGLYRRVDGQVVANEGDVPLRDLDSLPRWDERLYQPLLEIQEPLRTDDQYWMPVDVGRGCPFSCTFCASSRFWRRTYRMKSPQRIVDDIEFWQKKLGIRSFSFNHDAFTVNKELVHAVCDEIIRRGLDVVWKCTTRVDCVDESLILKMKQAGLVQIELGVETGSPRMQKIIRKNLDLSRVREVVAFLNRNKLRVSLMFMYGFPEETEEDLAQTLELIFELIEKGLHYINLSYCHFSPNTGMTRQYYDELVPDPDIKMLERTVYGHAEGEELFRQHKALFPFRYHLHTPVRDGYQYLHFLVMLYYFLPRTGAYLREIYGRDDLRLYRDFYENNRAYLEQGYEEMYQTLKTSPLLLMENTMKNADPVIRKRMVEIMRFEVDLWRISHGVKDRQIREVYGFNYVDYIQRRPVRKYLPGSTEILLTRKNAKMELQVLRFVM